MFDKNIKLGDINNSNIQNIGNTNNINLNGKFITAIVVLLIILTLITLYLFRFIELNTVKSFIKVLLSHCNINFSL